MMRDFAHRAIGILRPLWTLLAIGFGAWFVAGHWHQIGAMPLTAGALGLSFLLSLAAKPFAAIQTQQSLNQVGRPLGTAASIHAYAIADVTKYIPGGIWAVVSRVDLYRRIGMGAKEIFRALAVEQAWLAGGAAGIGAALYLLGRWSGPAAWLLAGAALAAWIVALILGRRLYGGGAATPGLALAQLATWLLFGAGFAVLVPGAPDLPLFAGAFCIAFAAGLMVPFAPAGIGVREAVLAALLLGVAGTAEIARLLLLSRCLLVGVDFSFAAAAVPLTRAAWREASSR